MATKYCESCGKEIPEFERVPYPSHRPSCPVVLEWNAREDEGPKDDPEREFTERELTKPPELNREDIIKQVPLRVHAHDHAMLKIILKRDAMSIQKFMGLCIRAYLEGDPSMLGAIRTYRLLEAVPKDIREKHMLSQRERWSIFEEIEKGK